MKLFLYFFQVFLVADISEVKISDWVKFLRKSYIKSLFWTYSPT